MSSLISPQTAFQAEAFLPMAAYQRLTDLRIQQPNQAFYLAQQRKQRDVLSPDGCLNILACDHPARGVVKTGIDSLTMSNRHDYLARMISILQGDTVDGAKAPVDGLMASMDILEELLLLQEILERPFLNNKLLIASLNRGGLAGSAWELDDPMTGPTPTAVSKWRLDGVKILWRTCNEERDALNTLRYTTDMLREANNNNLPVFLEPLNVIRNTTGWAINLDATELARLVGVASALGNDSRRLWLKLPYCDNFDAVAQATTLPILLLGGESNSDHQMAKQLQAVMANHHNVRGAMMGRSVLYPANGDPLAAAQALQKIVHPQ